jgi:hypothetical protein
VEQAGRIQQDLRGSFGEGRQARRRLLTNEEANTIRNSASIQAIVSFR